MQRQVFILGAYGQKNLGDDALLAVFVEQFADYEIVVNSAHPQETVRTYGIRAVPTYFSWPRLARLRAIFGSTLIVFGGGSLLKEIEGGHVARLLYFMRIFLMLIMAKLLGRRTAMLGVGIGPLEHPLYCWLTRIAAGLTDLICVRDTASRDLLVAVGVQRTVHVTADPVFTLTTKPIALRDNDKPQAVVIPRYSLTQDECAAFAEACDRLVEEHGVQICFLPFQTGYLPKFDDLHAITAIRALMRHGDTARVEIPATAQEALATIGQAELVLSARLHGLIFAALQGVTPIAVSYEVKVRSFMEELGVSALCIDLRDLTPASLVERIDHAWTHREQIAADFLPRIGGLRAQAAQNFALVREESTPQSRSGGFLAGSAFLLASMTIVNAGNYAFNLVLGRWLGPEQFADLSLIVTLLLILSFIATALGQTTAKFAASHAATGDTLRLAGLRHWLGQRAWATGVLLAAMLILAAPLWQHFFRTASPWPFVILGLGIPAYFAQGVDRGILQGETRFTLLSLSYQAEMWVRLLAAILFVALGWSVNGAVGAVALSLVATWLVARRAGRGRPAPTDGGTYRAAGGAPIRRAGIDRPDRPGPDQQQRCPASETFFRSDQRGAICGAGDDRADRLLRHLVDRHRHVPDCRAAAATRRVASAVAVRLAGDRRGHLDRNHRAEHRAGRGHRQAPVRHGLLGGRA